MTSLPTASVPDTLLAGGVVVVPMLAKGIIQRRRGMVRATELVRADRVAGRAMQRLRERYGPGPVRLRVPARDLALVLDPADVHEVLEGSPEPFTPATREKRGALGHFQPHGVLISRGQVREDRRRFNEDVLDIDERVHRLGDGVTRVVREEARTLLASVDGEGVLTWAEFQQAFFRIIRRVTLGDSARDDHETTDLLGKLRAQANWSYVHPGRRRVQQRFLARVRGYVERAEPGSLASVVATTPARDGVDPAGQVPHWMFAFDAAGVAVYRALALLATHPAVAGRVAAELAGRDLDRAQDLPLLRACVLESVRLWPTTLAVLRQSTAETTWRGASAPAGTSFVVASSFFHRDERTLPYADRFEPDVWLDGRAREGWSLVPFSAGPGRCPGKNLVLLVTSTLLAALLENRDVRQTGGGRLLHPGRRLPRTLDHFRLGFALEPRRVMSPY